MLPSSMRGSVVNPCSTHTYTHTHVHTHTHTHTHNTHTHTQVVALYDYEAQGDQELDLVEGDMVTILQREDDVWWMGQKLNDGQSGMFPAAYVELYEGDDPR